jgi:hypothetical protein
MVDSNNGVTLKINARGDVEFTDDDTDVKTISSGGWIVIERREGGIAGYFASDVKRFEAREKDGTLVRKYVFNGREVGADEGRAWLATWLPDRLREMGINADRRVARLLSKGGPGLVLSELSKIHSDFSTSRHLRELYKQATLDQPTLSRSFEQAARDISSDFELAQALKEAVERQPVDGSMPAFINASRSIESDFEQRRVLAEALSRPGLTPATAGQLFKAATPGGSGSGIESDFELGRLLQDAARGGYVTDANVQAFLDAAHAVGSDFERGRVVQALGAAKLSDAATADIVRLAASIGSDFEKSQAIVGLSRRTPLGAATRKALADAAMGIGSDFERGRALTALTKAGALEKN